MEKITFDLILIALMIEGARNSPRRGANEFKGKAMNNR